MYAGSDPLPCWFDAAACAALHTNSGMALGNEPGSAVAPAGRDGSSGIQVSAATNPEDRAEKGGQQPSQDGGGNVRNETVRGVLKHF